MRDIEITDDDVAQIHFPGEKGQDGAVKVEKV